MHIIGSKKAAPSLDMASMRLKDRPMIISSDMDDGGWAQPREWNRVFVTVLGAVVQLRPELRGKIYIDPTMSAEQQQKALDVGIFEAHFNKWSVVLNWTTRRTQQVIPARHMAVGYVGEPAGIIGPFLTARECWRCGHGGLKRNHDGIVRTGHPCPKCRTKDWFAKIAEPAHLQRDAAEVVADSMSNQEHQERWFRHMSADSEVQIQKGEYVYGA